MNEGSGDHLPRHELPAEFEDLRAQTDTSHADAPPMLARFARPRTETRTTLAIVSDPHVSTAKEETWKVFHRTERRLRAAVTDIEARDVDGVVFAGDLTEDGRPADFELVADVLSDLRVPFVAVPGNHDVPKDFDDHETPPISDFEADFTPGELPFHERIGGVDVLGLNSASNPDGSLDDCHGGEVSPTQLDWLDNTLPETETPIVVSHHNMAGLADRTDADPAILHSPLGDDEEFTETLARHDAALHLSGHVHLPAVTENRGVRGAVVPALCSFPQAYTLLEVGPDGTTLRIVPVADREGVAESYRLAQSHSARSRGVSNVVAEQLADLPLVDERAPREAHTGDFGKAKTPLARLD